MFGTVDLVAQLRNRLQDDRPIVVAFNLSATGNARSVVVETTRSSFLVTVSGGETVDSVRLPTGGSQYNTVGKVIEALQHTRGLSVSAAADSGASSHPASDLYVDGLPDIAGGKTAAVRHCLFSDATLIGLIQEAIQLHNPTYTLGTIPTSEAPLVLLKAQVLAQHQLANDTVRRKAMDMSFADIMSLADRTDGQYKKALERLGKSVSVPKIDETNIGSGEFINGKAFRKSLRFGYDAASASALNIQPPTLFEPEDRDIEDVSVRLHFSPNKEEHFSGYELWRDIQPTVERSYVGARRDTWRGSTPSPWGYQPRLVTERPSTARLVAGGGSFDPYDTREFEFGTYAEMGARNFKKGSVVDGPHRSTNEPLEPNTTYYYRLYARDINGNMLGSNVVRVTTRNSIARFLRLYTPPASYVVAPTAILPIEGVAAGGTLVTILGTGFTEKTVVAFGAKRVPLVSVAPTVLTVLSPTFVNAAFVGQWVDVTLFSNNEAHTDTLVRGWRVLP